MRTLVGIVVLLFSASLFAQMPTLKACGHHDYPPWNWLSAGKIVGSCAEIATRAFASIGYQLDLKYEGPWARCQNHLNHGFVDVSICAVPNEERAQSLFIVSMPMGYNEVAVFTKKQNQFEFTGLEDLRGRTLGMVNGVKLGEPLDTFFANHLKMEFAFTSESNWRKLNAGRIDIVVMGREGGRAQLQMQGLSQSIVDLPRPVNSLPLHVMISRKSKYADALAKQLPALSDFFAHPTYPAILNKAQRDARNQYSNDVNLGKEVP